MFKIEIFGDKIGVKTTKPRWHFSLMRYALLKSMDSIAEQDFNILAIFLGDLTDTYKLSTFIYLLHERVITFRIKDIYVHLSLDNDKNSTIKETSHNPIFKSNNRKELHTHLRSLLTN